HCRMRRRSVRLWRSSTKGFTGEYPGSASEAAALHARGITASAPDVRSALDEPRGHDTDDAIEQTLHEQRLPGIAETDSLYHRVHAEKTHAVQPGHRHEHHEPGQQRRHDELRGHHAG